MFARSRTRLADLAGRLSSPLPIDAYLRMLDPLWSSGGFRGRIVAIVPETSRAATIVIRPGTGWPTHRPGQWIGLGVDIDGVRHRRCYSLTSVPGRADGCIAVTVQAIPDGVVSNHLVRKATLGSIVHLDPPAGDFVLPAGDLPPLLFVTGGSGITPVMGMLRTLAETGGIADAVLIHHAPTAEEAIFAAELASLTRRYPGLVVTTAITGPGAPPPDAQVTVDRLDRDCPDWRERQAWACGPAPMLADAESTWAGVGLAERLTVERFRPALRPIGDPGDGGQVAFVASGTAAIADGVTPILEVAEAAGLSPAHGCRMGICHGCVTELVSGCVRDLRDGTVHDEPGQLVQICVSAAAGDVQLAL